MLRDMRVVVRGAGELGSAAARLLFSCGFAVAVLELGAPLAVRRRVCFAEAVFSGGVEVDGVPGRLVPPGKLEVALRDGSIVPVAVDPEGDSISRLHPAVLVDGRMAKRNLGTRRDQAGLVIGLGPGFTAGDDVHAVVETQRGAGLGRVLWSGSAEEDTAVPGTVMGVSQGRVLRAPRAGAFRGVRRIGDLVTPGTPVGEVEGVPVLAAIGGLLRGLLADGVTVEAGLKVGDVDPRGTVVDPGSISDKGRAVAAGVLEAILVSMKSRP